MSFLALLLATPAVAGDLYKDYRTVRVKVVADDDFRRQHPDWEERVGTIVRDVSRRWEKEFGIRFAVKKYEPWRSDAKLADLDALARQIISGVDKRGVDIIIGITAQRNVPLRPDAHTKYPQAVILLREVRTPAYLANVLLPHEMGHVFGAVHVRDKNSIMHIKSNGGPYDSFSSRIIWTNRQRNFVLNTCPLEEKEGKKAVRAYYQVIDAKKTDGYDVYRMAGVLLQKCSDCSEMIKIYELAVNNLPNNSEAHSDLGAIYWNCDRHELVRRELEKALKLNPKNKNAQENLDKLTLRGY